VEAIAANARAGAPWRADLGLPEPTGALASALNSLAATDNKAG